MSSENNIDNEIWTTIVKKQRKNTKKIKTFKLPYTKFKPQNQFERINVKKYIDDKIIEKNNNIKFVAVGQQIAFGKTITKGNDEKDITLTLEETEMLANSGLNIFCDCCQSELISAVICRPFFACGCCFCCVGGREFM
jgi:FAD synthase